MRARTVARYGTRLLPLLVLGVLLAFFSLVNPLSSGPFGVLVAFVLLYVLIASLLYTTGNLLLVVIKDPKLAGKFAGRRLYVAASILAFGPVLLLALNSLGQLSLEDFVLVVLLVSIAFFYFMRRS